MTHQSPIRYAPGTADAGHQVAQLRDVLGLVRQLAGGAADDGDPHEQSARIASAYGNADPVVQKRFDALAAETASWAAAAVEALARSPAAAGARAAASALASELAQAVGELVGMLGEEPCEPSAAAQPLVPSWLERPGG